MDKDIIIKLHNIYDNTILGNLDSAHSDLADIIATSYDTITTVSLSFVMWYSGMDEEKILKAYDRYLREETNK